MNQVIGDSPDPTSRTTRSSRRRAGGSLPGSHYANSASSASPTAATPDQLAAVGGRQIARVDVASWKDTASEPHLRSFSHPAGCLGHRRAPRRPARSRRTRPSSARTGRLRRLDATAAATARSAAGSSIDHAAGDVHEHVVADERSGPRASRGRRAAATGGSGRTRSPSAAGCRRRLLLTSACTSTRIGRDPSMQHSTAEPGRRRRAARPGTAATGSGTGRRPLARHLEHAELARPRRTGSSPRG